MCMCSFSHQSLYVEFITDEQTSSCTRCWPGWGWGKVVVVYENRNITCVSWHVQNEADVRASWKTLLDHFTTKNYKFASNSCHLALFNQCVPNVLVCCPKVDFIMLDKQHWASGKHTWPVWSVPIFTTNHKRVPRLLSQQAWKHTIDMGSSPIINAEGYNLSFSWQRIK